MRPAVVLGVNLLAGGAALGWVLWRFGAPALAVLATRPSAALLAAFLACVGGAFVGFALRWRLLLVGLGLVEPLRRLVAYRAAGQSVSTLVPSGRLGGEPLRVYLLVRDRLPAAGAIASVAVDRTLELTAGAPFACLFAALLVQRGVPVLEGALVTVVLSVVALLVGIVVTARRLRRGAGLATAVARATGLDRLRLVEGRLGVMAEAEGGAARLLEQPQRLARALALGVAVNLLVLVEYHVLLSAFGLPAGLLAVVAAIFGTGAAHSVPVPAGVGVLEGAQIVLFSALGHPAEVGLAVGLVVRLRELVWILPGVVYLASRGVIRAYLAEAR